MTDVERKDPSRGAGRLSAMVMPEAPSLQTYPITKSSWVKLVILAGLVALLYRIELVKLANQWWADANWSHGFILPLFSLYLLYAWRFKLLSIRRKNCYWGWVFILLALLIRAATSTVFPNDWIQELSIPVLIFGLVWCLCGPRMARLTFVPIFFVILAMPLPKNLYQELSLPLQNLAAKLSTGLLRLFGAHIEVSASFMEVTTRSGQVQQLEVAEACSGMRSLMAFVALGVIMAYIEDRPFWQRVTIILAGIPIALLVNVLRVATTSTMFWIDKKELGEDFMHMFMGIVLLIPALLLLFAFTRLLDSLYEEVEDEEEPGQPAQSPEGKS
jgi:exosortase